MAIGSINGTNANSPVTNNIGSSRKLSDNAQNYLSELKEKYSDVNITVADFRNEKQFDSYMLGSSGFNNIVIASNIIEKMANDPAAAAKYEKVIADVPKSGEVIKSDCDAMGIRLIACGARIDEKGKVTYWGVAEGTRMQNPGTFYKEKMQNQLEEKRAEKKEKEALEKKRVAIAETKEELLKKIKDNWKNYHNRGKLDISNTNARIIADAVNVEISSEGLKALKDEEKIAFLQKSLQKVSDLYRIEPGNNLRSKYGYVSTGERMKEYAPDKYAELSTMLEEAFKTNSTELYKKAAKYMVNWEKSFIEPHKSIENEIVHYDKKANHLPAYSGIFDVDKTIATAVENCSKEDQAFVYDIIRNNFLIANSCSMTEEERQANISLGMKKAEYAANNFIDADHRKAFLNAMETVGKLASAGKADGHGNMDYGVNKANYLGSGANMVQTTDPLAVMQESDSKAYEEYQRLRSAGNDEKSAENAFKYLVKWYSNAVSSNNKLIENYEKKSQEYVEEKVKN